MDTHRLSRDVGWLWAGYFGRAAGYFGLILVFTRALGADGFGTLSLFLAVTLGVSQVAGSWPFLAVPVLSVRERTIGAAFRPALYVAAIATAACLVVAIPVSLAIGLRAPVTLLSVAACSIALVGLQGIYAVQQTEGRMAGIAALQTAERVIALVLALVVVALSGLGVIGAEVLLTVASVLTCGAAFAVIGRRQRLLRRPPDEHPDHVVGTVVAAVGAMGIVSVCSYGVGYVDIFVLSAFRSNADVGIYSLAYQVFAFVIQLTSYWMVAALPGHARSTAAGEELSVQLPLRRLLPYTGLWSALIAATAFGSALLLPVAFGEGFEATVPPLLVLLGGSAVYMAAYFAVLTALVGAGRTRLLAQISMISVAINIGLDLVLVPTVGLVGPAFATLGQTVFGMIALSLAVLGAGATLRLLAVGLPATAATMLLALSPLNPALLALCGLTAVGMALFSLRLVRRRDPLPGAPDVAPTGRRI